METKSYDFETELSQVVGEIVRITTIHGHELVGYVYESSRSNFFRLGGKSPTNIPIRIADDLSRQSRITMAGDTKDYPIELINDYVVLDPL